MTYIQHKRLIHQSDQTTCTHCGKTWDINDIDPPSCTVERHMSITKGAGKTPANVAVFGGRSPSCYSRTKPQYMDETPANRPATANIVGHKVYAFAVVYQPMTIATMVYATSIESAASFFYNSFKGVHPENVLKVITVERMTAADGFGAGTITRLELNPKVIGHLSSLTANNGWQYRFHTPVSFLKTVGGVTL